MMLANLPNEKTEALKLLINAAESAEKLLRESGVLFVMKESRSAEFYKETLAIRDAINVAKLAAGR